MTRNPIYIFDTTSDTGIDIIPDNSIVVISDSDGSGTSRQVFKKDSTGLTASSTIQDFLDNDTLYDEVILENNLDNTSVVQSKDDGVEHKISSIVKISQADYDALSSYESDKVYIII